MYIKSSSDQQKNESRLKAYAKFSGMAIQMAVLIGGGALGGRALDNHYQTEKPVWAIVFSLLGIAISLYLIIRSANKMSKDD